PTQARNAAPLRNPRQKQRPALRRCRTGAARHPRHSRECRRQRPPRRPPGPVLRPSRNPARPASLCSFAVVAPQPPVAPAFRSGLPSFVAASFPRHLFLLQERFSPPLVGAHL